MADRIAVLLVEQRADEVERIVKTLKQTSVDYIIQTADCADRALTMLEHSSPDIVISEYSLPDGDVLKILEVMKKAQLNIPLIVVSATLDPISATDVMKAGAADYVIKDKIARLPYSVQKTLAYRDGNKDTADSLTTRTIRELESRVALRTAELENCTRILNSEREKRDGAESYKKIIDLFSPDPVFRYTRSAGVSYCNDAAAKLLRKAGIISSNPTIEDIEKLLPQGISFRGALEEALDYEKQTDFSNHIQIADATFTFSVISLRDINRGREAWIVGRNKTEQRMAEDQCRTCKQEKDRLDEKLRESENQRRLAEKQKNEFMSVVSHDLRAPLTSIVGFAETMITPDMNLTEEEKRRFLKIIKDEGKRLGEFIGSFLEVSKIESGEMNLEFSEISLFDFLHEVIDSLSVPNHIDVGIPDDYRQQIVLKADEKRLRQVFTHILNAVLETVPKNGVISVFIEENNSTVDIAVQSAPSRLNSFERTRLFDRFFRGEVEEWTQSQRGAELKLTIAKGLVSAHGGRLWYDSHENTGKIFYVQLPLNVPEVIHAAR